MKRLILLMVITLGVMHGWCSTPGDSLTISRKNSAAYKYFLSKPDSAIMLANEAIALAEKNKYNFQAAFGYYVLSKAHWTKANYFLSIVFGFKALKIYENTTHTFHWGQANLAIARTFVDLKNYDQCLVLK